jgi:Flp pilus assembly protein TadG
MGQQTPARKSFLRSLLHDKTANTIVIAAASMFPILAMVGGGIDASRYYMAASRMQAACDAGALAARRAMITDDFEAEHRIIGERFFDQNFTDGMFSTEERVRNYTTNGDGRVDGTASTTLPTTIMSIFGYNELELEVTCSAEINISNTDIMFVLDVTGSMNCPISNPSCNQSIDNPGSKLRGLREAVLGFYDTTEAATSTAAQVRYGFVPYSVNANVGGVIPTQFMATTHTYQSRVARFREQFTFIPGNGVEVGDEMVISDQTEWLPRSTANFNSTTTDHYRFRTSGTTERNAATNFCSNTLPGTYTVNGQTWAVSSTNYQTGVWSGGSSNNRAGCSGRVRKTRIATASDVIADQNIRSVVFQDFIYCPVTPGLPNNCSTNNPVGSPAGWETVNLSTLYDDNQIMTPTGNSGAMVNQFWSGCVEEANTVQMPALNVNPFRRADADAFVRPAGAFDLNINLVPETEAQRWKPMLRDIMWKREDGTGNVLILPPQTGNEIRPSYSCPTPARRLAEVTRADLVTFTNSLVGGGQTYHDVGMIWGARFISPRGIFRADNEAAPNGDSIARHIVFMTDGAQVNDVENYSTHGVEWWDRRITNNGNATAEFNSRAARLQVACSAARRENITVWVVAFGTALTQNLTDCASPGRAFTADDPAALNDRFREIAQQIAELRLTQ